MAYTPTYVSSDLSAIISDLLATIFANLVPFAVLIALLILYYFFSAKKHKYLGF